MQQQQTGNTPVPTTTKQAQHGGSDESVSTKRCPKCGVTKDHSEFHKNKSRGDGLTPYCKSCDNEQSREWQKANLEKARERDRNWREANREKYREQSRTHTLKQYGLTPKCYAAMEQQGGLCANCDKPPAKGKKLHVDHCHATGHVRELLCHHCNTAIGLLKDDPELCPQDCSLSAEAPAGEADAALEGLAARHAAYVRALERVLVVMSKAPSPQHGIETLQAR